MNIDLTKYDEQHAAYIEALSGKLESIYKEIIKLAVKYGLSVNFDAEAGEIFDFDKFPKLKKKVEELFDDMHEQITTLVQNAISTEWQFSADKYDFWLSEMLDKGDMTKDEIEAYIKRNNEAIQSRRNEALEAFRKRTENGMNLSDRVWKLTEQFKSELELALDVGISEGKSADAISRDIRQYLNNPDKLFRRVRDKYGNLKLSKAAEAYHPGQGVYRSSYKNALRVARTEVNMAYRTADHENWSAEKMVIGIRVSLSNNHTLNGKPFFDICDELKGMYPKEFKFTSWHPMCYSDDSEVYTDSGWKFFKDVKDTDSILSLNPDTFDLEYTNILLNFKRWHKGDMIHLYNRSLSQLVTPEHEVLYLSADLKRFKRVPAEKCSTTRTIYRSSKWKGQYNPYVQVGSLKVKIEDYAEFMGYWLSDGSLGHYPEVSIAQQDDNKYNIHKCMERINGKAWMGKYKVGFNVKDWYEHLKQFGKCTDKFVPECIKQSTPEVIEIFLKAFVSCDGYIRKPKAFIGSRGTLCQSTKEERVYVTTSVRMADDIGELILKIGHRPSFYVDNSKGRVQKFRNGEYTINNDCIRISECNSITATQYYKERVPYEGYVYDLTLEKNHIMYIRRNGKCFWGSNCRCWATPITPTQEEVIDYTKKLMAGEDVSNYKFKGEVTELPKAFRFWYAKNYSRVARMRHKPNFITDNQSLIEGKHTPTIEPSVKEINMPSIYDKIRETEQQIRLNKNFETAVVYDNDGNVLIDKRGSARNVAFTKDECEKMKDAILTHNHPGGWKYSENSIMRIGSSFSAEDIILATAYNMNEIRAVTPIYTFSMKRPKEGWGINWKEAKKEFVNARKIVDRYMNDYFRKVGTRPENYERANALCFHLVNRILAKKYGWEYTKIKG